MTVLLVLAACAIAAITIRAGRRTRTIQNGTATQTWAQASDARFPRYPHGRHIGRRGGLK